MALLHTTATWVGIAWPIVVGGGHPFSCRAGEAITVKLLAGRFGNACKRRIRHAFEAWFC